MKKFLYMTTALAAAGLIMSSAGDARAAERIKVGITGFHQQYGVIASQDVDAYDGQTDFDTSLVDQKHNSEIIFKGETALDNGITVGINVQLEANDSGDQIDESFLFVEGVFGLLQMGDTDNAAYKMHVTAPDGGLSINDGDIVGIDAFLFPATFLLSDTPLDSTYLSLTDGDSGKFSYYTPRFAGVQLGFSYIPQFEGGGDNNSSLVRTGNQDATGPVKDGFAFGLNYTQDFSGIGVQGSLGYLMGDTPGCANTPGIGDCDDNIQGYNGGIQISYAGFTVGGSYMHADGDVGGTVAPGYKLDGFGWTAGIAYTTGPYTVGYTYQKGQTEGFKQVNAKNYLDQHSLSGTYVLGPGVNLVGGFFYADADGEDDALAGAAIESNEAFGFISGLELNF
jgi:hypothetical protein